MKYNQIFYHSSVISYLKEDGVLGQPRFIKTKQEVTKCQMCDRKMARLGRRKEDKEDISILVKTIPPFLLTTNN